MWIYEKKLQYPARVSGKDIKMAKNLVTQYGGPDGELSASLRYLNQRYSMPTERAKAILTDIGTEELAHMEIIASLVYKLIKGASAEEMEEAGLGGWYAQHDNGMFWSDANGVPWSAKYVACLGDPVADLTEDMAAEQKARATYEHLIHLTDDQGIIDTLRFLREREVVHFQRFGETLDYVQALMNEKKYY
ncbi:manganese catalase family protein [Candidatus Formimonas warabiya]|uniref:Rubrerythrin family protein n=1 Tax=Formimonas warabiya TaxID=1761012 RepID=A0A3G1KLW4_FORW1|nr:manganese catalase family protein [Candidatus Formimonas warabiya]ATW23412.1 rubrerythrin family protein [Candidatus Formimonas warabiya]